MPSGLCPLQHEGVRLTDLAEIERQWAERIGEERVAALGDALKRLYELERLSRGAAPAPAASSG
jgi:hypothetical protein